MKFLHTFTKCGFLMAVLLLLSNAALAQRTVKGKVTDAESSEGLIGATVTVVGTTRGAVTDIDGNYSVEVPEGSTQVRFAYTGYEEQVVTLSASNVVEVAMKPGSVLDEVVVVGYGTIKSKEVTSSIASLKREDFNKGNITSAAQLIQGKVAGVSVARAGSDPNGEFSIRLRGLSSLSAGQSPLVVLDGVPGASLGLIDPNDIASIDILKDGSAAAIYGTRASAGVILISTKQGAAGRTTADYNGYVAFDQVARHYKTLSAERFVALGGDDLSPNDQPGDTDTDWFDEITQTGVSQVHNLGLSGGIGNGSYRISFNYRDVDGILRTSGFKQYNTGLSFNQKMLDNRLTITGNLALTSKDADYSFEEAFRYAVINNPTAAIRDQADPEYTKYDGYVEKALFDYFNPVAIIEQNFNRGRINRLLGNAHADFQIISGLSAGVTLAQERKDETTSEFYSKQSKFRGNDRNGLGRQTTSNDKINTLEVTGNYNLDLGSNSSLKLLGGYSYQDFTYDGIFTEGGNIISDEFTNTSLGNYLDFRRGLGTVTSYKNTERLVAFFGRASFNYQDKFFVSAGVRREGSTRFGPNNKWGIFPFVSGGTDIKKFVDIEGVDQLKIRVGYGVTGNRPSENSLYRRVYQQGPQFFYNGTYIPSYAPVLNPNPDLKWEEKGEFDAGIDYAIADYKLSGSLDYYDRLTKDLIQRVTVPTPPNLADKTTLNAASISSRGFEATINANNVVNTENFKYTPGLVFSTYTVRLKDYNETGDTVAFANVGAPGQNGVSYTLLYNGAPLGQLWGPVRTGVSGDGKVTYEDIDGDGLTGGTEIEGYNQDQRRIGNGTPKFELGLNNSFTFGHFDLNFFLRGVFGHDLANEYRVFYENLDPTAKTWNKVDTKYFDERVTGANRFDNTHVEKATFVRLDNATLGYNFGLASTSWFSNARVYVSGQNLFTITDYSGVDPEARVGDPGSVDNGGRESLTLDPLAPGIDRRSTYFLARTVSVGVSLGF